MLSFLLMFFVFLFELVFSSLVFFVFFVRDELQYFYIPA